MSNLEQTEQALFKLEEVREMIREVEVELREPNYCSPPEARHHLSEAASGLAVADRALRSVLEIFGIPDETSPKRFWSGTEEGTE